MEALPSFEPFEPVAPPPISAPLPDDLVALMPPPETPLDDEVPKKKRAKTIGERSSKKPKVEMPPSKYSGISWHKRDQKVRKPLLHILFSPAPGGRCWFPRAGGGGGAK